LPLSFCFRKGRDDDNLHEHIAAVKVLVGSQ
jgi:hypothetical protein